MQPGGEKSLPMDLSHHFSEVAKRRVPNEMKRAYQLFQIPGIRNLAGGLPNAQFFPFDTLEAQAARPERWSPSAVSLDGSAAGRSSGQGATAAHIAVPKVSGERDIIKRIDLSTALQYGQAQGYPPLLSWVRQFTREILLPDFGYRGGPDVAMSCGSTDAFAKVLNLFVNSWTEGVNDVGERPGLLCETFVYGIPLSEGLPRGMQVVPIESDESGISPGDLENTLAGWDSSKGKRPHIMYTVTLGHNPTGNVVSLERKKEVYAVCSKYDVIIVEDEPYWYLQFPSAAAEEAKSRGHTAPSPATLFQPATSTGYPFIDSLTPTFLKIDTDGRVIRLDTFSKTVAPGCRLGWITAQPAVVERYIRITETSTQQPSGFVQSLVAELIIGPQPEARSAFARATLSGTAHKFTGWQMSGWIRWLSGLRGSYERRMVRMCQTLDAGMDLIQSKSPRPSLISNRDSDSDWGTITKTNILSYSWPRGGMFVWLRIKFECHPLWHAPSGKGIPVDGPMLSTALLMFLTRKPYLVIAAPGPMFSSSPEIRNARGWAYYRLCFAAETDENVEASSQKFVEGVHAFWKIKSVEEIEKLLDSFPHMADVRDLAEGLGQIGALFGC
ncbi:pyridoxal phosphate-dependent transferase [Immersiella caudata]|uniref:Pyridoxal phosphate-dependent transferase n=1 Tax=Immersiella caudata TaxID=314043 RepID=A0AA39X3E1_9PEZI|nr:pyridoxal phosphate-dependent transferase [Immersiella caudata]